MEWCKNRFASVSYNRVGSTFWKYSFVPHGDRGCSHYKQLKTLASDSKQRIARSQTRERIPKTLPNPKSRSNEIQPLNLHPIWFGLTSEHRNRQCKPKKQCPHPLWFSRRQETEPTMHVCPNRISSILETLKICPDAFSVFLRVILLTIHIQADIPWFTYVVASQ